MFYGDDGILYDGWHDEYDEENGWHVEYEEA